MKIALVHEMLVKLGGAERVLKALTDLFPEAPIYTLFHNPKVADEWFRGKTIITPQTLSHFIPPKFQLSKLPAAIEAFDFSGFDVVISSSSAFAHGIKKGPNTKHIVYCHSPMRYAWDYTHEYTKSYHPLLRLMIAKKLNPIRLWDFNTAQKADLVLANARHTQKRIEKYWRRPSDVLYPPVDVRRFTPQNRHENFFLIVSALTPFKKIDLAIRAFNKTGEKLVIVGEGSQKKYLESIAHENITFLGRQSDEKTKEYFEKCRALIFPGEEDFGITPVEAMAAGKPVLAYGIGGVTESVQAGISGEFFLEPTPESLEAGLKRLIAHEKTYDPKKIRQIAEQFDGSVFKEKMKAIMTSLQ